MELDDVIKARHSIRKFKPDPVPDTDIKKIIEAARLAPSGSNLQHPRYIVVRSNEGREKLKECTLMPFVHQAPVIIICCVDSNVWATADARREELNKAQIYNNIPQDVLDKLTRFKKETIDSVAAQKYEWLNAGIAVEHMVLKATELGLASCWVCIVDREKTRRVFDIDNNYEVVALLPIGYPDEDPEPRPRLSMNTILIKEI